MAGMSVLVVDGANVVGSVPDGWWRDRAGAAARLHARLVEAELAYDVVELVLEGRAKSGVSAGDAGGVTTVHAPGEGDDEIVDRCRGHAQAGAAVTVVTADRGLRARTTALGVETMGPGTLRTLLT